THAPPLPAGGLTPDPVLAVDERVGETLLLHHAGRADRLRLPVPPRKLGLRLVIGRDEEVRVLSPACRLRLPAHHSAFPREGAASTASTTCVRQGPVAVSFVGMW